MTSFSPREKGNYINIFSRNVIYFFPQQNINIIPFFLSLKNRCLDFSAGSPSEMCHSPVLLLLCGTGYRDLLGYVLPPGRTSCVIKR